jgi:hypothetical protein
MGKKARTFDAAVDAVIQDVVEKHPFVINVRDAAVKLAKSTRSQHRAFFLALFYRCSRHVASVLRNQTNAARLLSTCSSTHKLITLGPAAGIGHRRQVSFGVVFSRQLGSARR